MNKKEKKIKEKKPSFVPKIMGEPEKIPIK